jgi:hypothetical protein
MKSESAWQSLRSGKMTRVIRYFHSTVVRVLLLFPLSLSAIEKSRNVFARVVYMPRWPSWRVFLVATLLRVFRLYVRHSLILERGPNKTNKVFVCSIGVSTLDGRPRVIHTRKEKWSNGFLFRSSELFSSASVAKTAKK